MELTLTTFLTLDGVMQAPGGPDEDQSGGFEQGGWQVPYDDEDVGRFIDYVFDQVDAFLLGRRTYDIFAGYWPLKTDPDDAIASRLNNLPKYVASKSLKDPTWAETTVLDGDIAQQVAKLKARPGRELQIWGSGALVSSLMRHGLIDRYRLLTYPVMLGAGQRLFKDGLEPAALRLVDSRTTGTGVTIGVYEPAGEPEYGSFD